jgi:hypothetical protein
VAGGREAQSRKCIPHGQCPAANVIALSFDPSSWPRSWHASPIARGLGIHPNYIQLALRKLLNMLELPWKRSFLPAGLAIVQVNSLRCIFLSNSLYAT